MFKHSLILLLCALFLSSCGNKEDSVDTSSAASSASQAEDPNKPKQAKKVDHIDSNSPVVFDPEKKKKWEQRKKEAQK